MLPTENESSYLEASGTIRTSVIGTKLETSHVGTFPDNALWSFLVWKNKSDTTNSKRFNHFLCLSLL